MTVRQAEPLPECHGCGLPTRREVWTGGGGLCSGCSEAIRLAEALRPRHDGLRPLFDLDGER